MMVKDAVRNGLDAEGMLARVLYRDGLMLVIDKPAGLPVHRGPKGVQASRTISTRCDSGCRARPR
jgi:23S rRNA-/tRNA-specific pseudouridylate synthase